MQWRYAIKISDEDIDRNKEYNDAVRGRETHKNNINAHRERSQQMSSQKAQ